MSSSQSKKRRIGFMGGSFDPVHSGHLIIAQDAVEQLGLDEVIFIPAAIPPHKQDREQVSAYHRMEMVKAALEPVPNCSVSDLELCRGGVSYSVDTVRDLLSLYPDDELVMIIGSDTVIDLHTWYRIDDLLSLCEVATFLRPGVEQMEDIRIKIEVSEAHKEKLIQNIFKAHLIELSSTEIRERVGDGRSIHAMVPSEVEAYIYKEGLYRD